MVVGIFYAETYNLYLNPLFIKAIKTVRIFLLSYKIFLKSQLMNLLRYFLISASFALSQ